MPSDEEVIQRAGSLQAMTGVTKQAFEALLPHCEHALVTYLQDRTSAGHPRTSRRYSTYDNCPLPTTADKQRFILTYVKQHLIQAVQGHRCGMSQSNANTWIHRLPAVLHHALAHQELLPARHAAAVAVMLAAKRTAGVPPPPLFGMMARSDQSTAPPIPRTSRHTTAASRRVTRSRTSS